MPDLSWFEATQVSGGKPLQPPPADLLHDLYDLIVKFGVDDPRGPIRRVAHMGDEPVHASAVITDGNMNMTVSRMGGGGFIGEQCVGYVLSDPLPSGVIWDMRISHDDVREMIREIDAEMRYVAGAFDLVTGERCRAPRDTGNELVIRVDEYFRTRGAMAFVPEGFDAEEYRQLFDRPDDLVVLEAPDGTRVLHRTIDTAFIAHRARVIRKILYDRHGITDGDMSSLSKEEQQKVLAEAFSLLKKLDN